MSAHDVSSPVHEPESHPEDAGAVTAIECGECGEHNPERARFCLRCGAQLVMTMAPAELAPPRGPSTPLPWSTQGQEPANGAAGPAWLETVPPPEKLSEAAHPGQWACLVCGTSNEPARALCSYCGNRRGASTDETSVFPADLALAPTEVLPAPEPAPLPVEAPLPHIGLRERLGSVRLPALRPRSAWRWGAVVALGVVVVAAALVVGSSALAPGEPAATAQAVVPPAPNPPAVVPPAGNPPAVVPPDRLVAVDELGVGGHLRSENGQFLLTLEPDGNLVVEDSHGARNWESRTAGAVKLAMQDDGNLVLYRADLEPVWATDTNASTGAYWVILQDDGNLVLHDPGGESVLWSSMSDAGCVGPWCGACLFHCP